MILGDYHLHSSISEDSDTPMEQQIEAGIAAGLKYMCFTEHMDRDFLNPVNSEVLRKYEPDLYAEGLKHRLFEPDMDAYMEAVTSMREKYKDRIDVRFGIEYGLQPHLREHNEEFINSYPFDFVIGSQHLCDNMDVYYKEYFERYSEKEAYRNYFEQLLENVTIFDNYDVLGHIDYVVRYGPNKNSNYRYSDYADVLEEILKQVIRRGKGIEINTGGYRSLENQPNPDASILKRYRELGGEIITFGSDAHKPAGIAYEFERARKLLVELKYEYYCVFKQRCPQFENLLL